MDTAAASAEAWSLVAIRALLGLIAIGFAGLSFVAYRREKTSALKRAIVGFLLIGVGLVVEIVYAILIKGDFFLTEMEVIRLQLIEGVIIVGGFTALLYSISGY